MFSDDQHSLQKNKSSDDGGDESTGLQPFFSYNNPSTSFQYANRLNRKELQKKGEDDLISRWQTYADAQHIWLITRRQRW